MTLLLCTKNEDIWNWLDGNRGRVAGVASPVDQGQGQPHNGQQKQKAEDNGPVETTGLRPEQDGMGRSRWHIQNRRNRQSSSLADENVPSRPQFTLV